MHCFLVPIRDEQGRDLPGVTTSDCGHKGGLRGVDNGRIMFDEVRIPRREPAQPVRRRRRGRHVLLAGREHQSPVLHDAGHAGARTGERRRLGQRDGRGRADHRRQVRAAAPTVRPVARTRRSCSIDYRTHQRRLLPLIARSYAYRFAQNQLVARMHRLQTTDEPDEHEQRELETPRRRPEGVQTWHAIARHPGVPRGLRRRRLPDREPAGPRCAATSTSSRRSRATTTCCSSCWPRTCSRSTRRRSPASTRSAWSRFAAASFAESVKERTTPRPAHPAPHRRPARRDDDSDLLDLGTQLSMFEDREEHVLETSGPTAAPGRQGRRRRGVPHLQQRPGSHHPVRQGAHRPRRAGGVHRRHRAGARTRRPQTSCATSARCTP